MTLFLVELTYDVASTLVKVEGGTFTMGATKEQLPEAYGKEKPMHKVTLSSFLISKFEVTQELWESVMGTNPSYFTGDNRPVELVSWNHVVDFCNKLSEKEGLIPVYTINKKKKDPNNNNKYDELKWLVTCNFNSNGYRLPTEAEWEYAARGGNESKGYEYSGGNNIDEVAWYDASGNAGMTAQYTSEVGIKQANELGLYDMSGNVLEWVWDWYGSYTSSSQTNPTGPNSGSDRVLRGGCWASLAVGCRVAYRDYFAPVYSSNNYGFRLVRTK